MSKLDSRMAATFGSSHEESPSITGQGCRVTPGGGDSRDSATEINRLWYLHQRQGWKGAVSAHRLAGNCKGYVNLT